MTDAERWVRQRFPGAPAELVEAMAEAARAHPGPVPEALARAAMDLYARVSNGAGDRGDALPLLAADALLTHAFEALAESGLASLEESASRWGTPALSALLP